MFDSEGKEEKAGDAPDSFERQDGFGVLSILTGSRNGAINAGQEEHIREEGLQTRRVPSETGSTLRYAFLRFVAGSFFHSFTAWRNDKECGARPTSAPCRFSGPTRPRRPLFGKCGARRRR